MCGRVRRERQSPVAEVDVAAVLDQHRGCDDRSRRVLAEDLLEPIAVVLASLAKCIRQARMTDESRVVCRESAGSKDMVGMHVRKDDEADRKRCDQANALAQELAVGAAATGVCYRDGIFPDDESDV